MATSPWLGALALAASLAGSLLGSRTAAACTAPLPSCTAPVRLFNDYPEPPGNLVYFKVLVDEPGELVLRTADGGAIPAGVRTIGNDRVFAPDAPLAAGLDVELEYTTVCPPNAHLEPEQKVYAFTTVEPQAMNLRPPELVVYEEGVRYPGAANSESVFSRLRYYSPDADGSVAHLINHHVSVDGRAHFASDDEGFPIIELSARCLPESQEPTFDTCGNIWWFGAGVHHVTTSSTVVGSADEPAEAELDLELRCPEAGGDEPPPGSAGSGNEPEGGKGNEPQAAGSGCALARSSQHGPLTLLGVLLGGGLLALRRRRPR